MKKKNSIHNLDTLEKEIYRLRLQARDMEKKLGSQLGQLGKRGPSMLARSLFSKKPRSDYYTQSSTKQGSGGKFNFLFNRFADKLTDKAANRLEDLLDRLFKKGK